MQGSIDHNASVATGEVKWSTELKQGGATTDTVCGTCNNRTGRWYNRAYVRMVKACELPAIPPNAGTVVDVHLEVHPMRVVKQALTTLLATCQSGITRRFPHVRQLLLDAEHRARFRRCGSACTCARIVADDRAASRFD